MKRTPRRHNLLRRIAAGENVGMEPGGLVDALVREHLIAPGLSDRLTDEGREQLAAWDAEVAMRADARPRRSGGRAA